MRPHPIRQKIKRSFLAISLLLISQPAFCCLAAEPSKLVDYGAEGVQAYAQCKHGPDGKILLDNYIRPYVEDVKDQVVLDAGCGAGPWSIVLAENGAIVHGIDIQSRMIEKAKSFAECKNLANGTFFQLGDVRSLPYPKNFFDKALSVNLICNLPGELEDCFAGDSLGLHFTEIARVLKKNGKIILTGPSSMSEILTDGKKPKQEVIEHIQRELKAFDDPGEHAQATFVKQFDHVLRASFVVSDGELTLVTHPNQLKPGQKVLRKIPGLALFMYYHPESVVIEKLQKAGFKINNVQKPVLTKNLSNQYPDDAQQLGSEYLLHNPFFVIEAEKVSA